MEPLSATASIFSILDITIRTVSALVAYSRDTRGASDERSILAKEASSLLHTLESIRDRASTTYLDPKRLAQQDAIVHQFQAACNDLVTALNFDPSTGNWKREGHFREIYTAAKWSFTKRDIYALLERISRIEQHANTFLLDSQHTLLEDIDQRLQEDESEKLKSAILKWLSPLQMVQAHHSISAQASEGSGRWFLMCPEYLSWRSGTDKFLWCFGIPGAGKTVIASIVVEDLFLQRNASADKEDMGIGFIYLKYNDPDQTLGNVLGSLLKQLTQDRGIIPECLQELYERSRDTNIPFSVDDFTVAMESLFQHYRDIFVIIDALDECSHQFRWDLIDILRKINIHLLVTSRVLDSIDEGPDDFKRCEIKANRADIELYIDQQIKKYRRLQKSVQKRPSLCGEIKDAVIKSADKMFLLARFHVESLESALTVNDVREIIRALPEDLDETYNKAWARIEAQPRSHRLKARLALGWITYAFRRLSLKELQHALAIEKGIDFDEEDDVIEAQYIVDICAGLVTIDPDTEMVNLVHYTTKKYFTERRERYFPNFHGKITMGCAKYLTMPALRDATLRTVVLYYPLATYAAQYMAEHARQNPEEDLEPPVLKAIYQLLSQPFQRKPLIALLDGLDLIKSGSYSSDEPGGVIDPSPSTEANNAHKDKYPKAEETVGDVSDENRSVAESSKTLVATETAVTEVNVTEIKGQTPEIPTSQMLEVTALHLAASMGLAKVASMLLKKTSNIDAVDETGKTALAVAMERGFEKAVELLVKSGARIDLGDDHGQGTLLFAVERDWKAVSDMIVRNAEATITDKKLDVALLTSVYYGEIQAVSLMVGRNKEENANFENSVGPVALFLAVECGYPEVVQLLLTSGVNVNSKDSVGQTSLHRATRRGNKALIRTLVDNGAEVDLQDDDGKTPWSANLNSNKDVLGLLLQLGADPNVRGPNGVSELYSAAAGGNEKVVKYMIESGTDPSIRTIFDWAPLHWAAYCGHTECVKLLIKGGADPNPISDQVKTPLDLAIGNNQDTITKILLDAGAKTIQDLDPQKVSHKVADRPFETTKSKDQGQSVAAITRDENHTFQSKLTLTFDQPLDQGFPFGQFIYLPEDNTTDTFPPYQISHPLDATTECISVRRALRRVEMGEYPLSPDEFPRKSVLYDIVRRSAQHPELKLRSNAESPLTGDITVRRFWAGSWQVHHKDESGERRMLFRTKTSPSPNQEDAICRWVTEDGRLLAKTSTSTVSFEKGLDNKILDVLVTCWIAKLWFENFARQNQKTGAAD